MVAPGTRRCTFQTLNTFGILTPRLRFLGTFEILVYVKDMAKQVPAGVLVRLVSVALVAASFAAPVALAQTPSLTLVGYPPPTFGSGTSHLYGLSADGRSASGSSTGTGGEPGFLWTADAGRNDFGRTLGLASTWGFGISGDGLTVVGAAQQGALYHAYRWSASGGYHDIGTLPGYGQSEARDANHDGSVIVGTLDNGQGTTPQAFRWTQSSGMQGLGAGTVAQAVSGNGNVIIGDFGTAPQAYTWTQANGLQFLPSLGGMGASLVRALNFDGGIVVGRSGAGMHTTMWTNGSPVELLSSIPDSVLTPFGVSDDGAVVAGLVNAGLGGLFAGVWTTATGTVRLSDYLAANGVTIPPGVTLATCTAVSADGRTFAGYTEGDAFGIQGFVATIPSPGMFGLLGAGILAIGRRRRSALLTQR
jgi:uncharacterized membrane protein